ncbi:putative transglycosylase [Caenibius tardaugens NBRC 16725]|uniref:Putative transglycosylase n=2 Tax=Caenibius TaxID=2827482 RepID=U2YK27_9SPHN|nr:lytic transglycosylase domain-containing protein [Caenibius tardaugens]AZI38213.1 lytic transglycosylase domain-containing protein [Caenibius tardaugens NBRC 16725]GAD48845.1 putative transglycosylase [Caenibius tardaugens NBRC 16725]
MRPRRCSACRRALSLVLFACLASAPATAFARPKDEPSARSSPVSPIAAHVAEASRRFAIPERWIWAVMRVESAGDVTAISHAGAMGLMQIMPGTWTELRARYRLGRNPYDPRDNVIAGTAYLRELHDRYGNPTAMLAAYNAGPGRYDEHLATGRPLPRETRAYLAMLTPMVGSAPGRIASGSPADALAWTHAPLFSRPVNVASGAVPDPSAAPQDHAGDAPEADALEVGDGLFVPLSGQQPS